MSWQGDFESKNICGISTKYDSSLLQDRARGKRKPILRSEASPPKFFIPEQKGKVVYKVPGDRGAIPSSSKYLQKGHLPLHHLLFTRSNALFAASVSVNFLKPSRPNRIQYTTIYCQSSVAQMYGTIYFPLLVLLKLAWVGPSIS